MVGGFWILDVFFKGGCWMVVDGIFVEVDVFVLGDDDCEVWKLGWGEDKFVVEGNVWGVGEKKIGWEFKMGLERVVLKNCEKMEILWKGNKFLWKIMFIVMISLWVVILIIE